MSYIISEKKLKKLLIDELELEQLKYGGVDNWEWYGVGREEFLLECVDGRIPEEEIPEDIDEEFIVELDIKEYEQYKGEKMDRNEFIIWLYEQKDELDYELHAKHAEGTHRQELWAQVNLLDKIIKKVKEK